MKAFLLAAGKGTRLKPITDDTPKCLAPILGQPLLSIWLDKLYHAGIREVLVNIHHHYSKVKKHLAESHIPLKIHTVYEKELLGSAGTIFTNHWFIRDNQNFLVIYADNLTSLDLKKIVSYHESHECFFTMGVVPTSNPGSKGIVCLDKSNIIISFEEKPATPKSNLSNAGIYVSTPELIDYIDFGKDRDLGYHVLPKLVGNMKAFIFNDYFRDIGTPADFLLAQEEWLNHRLQNI